MINFDKYLPKTNEVEAIQITKDNIKELVSSFNLYIIENDKNEIIGLYKISNNNKYTAKIGDYIIKEINKNNSISLLFTSKEYFEEYYYKVNNNNTKIYNPTTQIKYK